MAPVFERDVTYHIYNQGNNGQLVFPDHAAYLLFLWKMRTYLPLYGHLLAWCLMSNHFHWQFHVTRTAVPYDELQAHRQRVECQRRRWKFGQQARLDLPPIVSQDKWITLNDAIGQCQRTYTRAMNPLMKRTGSLFRQGFKAQSGAIEEVLVGVNDYVLHKRNYEYTAFHYIHANARQAGLVKSDTDYLYSSARDYAGLRLGTLCNLEMGRQLLMYW